MDSAAKLPCRLGKIIELLRISPELFRHFKVYCCHHSMWLLTPKLGMKLTHILLTGGIVFCISPAAPVPLLNFSGEINPGVDGMPDSCSA
jgi:hypothetical protein